MSEAGESLGRDSWQRQKQMRTKPWATPTLGGGGRKRTQQRDSREQERTAAEISKGGMQRGSECPHVGADGVSSKKRTEKWTLGLSRWRLAGMDQSTCWGRPGGVKRPDGAAKVE